MVAFNSQVFRSASRNKDTTEASKSTLRYTPRENANIGLNRNVFINVHSNKKPKGGTTRVPTDREIE